MIIKSSCRGSQGLAAHLAADENEVARVTSAEGIVSLDIDGAIAELIRQGAGSRTRSPLVHVSISPQQPLTDQQWARAWSEWEWARGLQEQPYIEIEHRKKGRSHRHRVYSRVHLERQAVIKQSHEKRINERVARSLELEFDHQLTPGAHSRAVQHWAEQHGRTDLAAAVAPAAAGDRPRADLPHHHWQQQERTGVDLAAVADAAFAAWRSSDSLDSFKAALNERGFALAAGRKTVQLVDGAGGCHDLRRTLAKRDRSVRAAHVRARVPMADLPPVHEVAERQRIGVGAAVDEPVSPDRAITDPGEPSVRGSGAVSPEPEVGEPAEPSGPADVDRIRQRLDDIEAELNRIPTVSDRSQFEERAIGRAKREARIPREHGKYTTLDRLEQRAMEMRGRATRARDYADDLPLYRFIERIRAGRQAKAAEYQAERAESALDHAEKYLDHRPHLWRPAVDEALARNDQWITRRQELERERDDLEQQLAYLEGKFAPAERLHGVQEAVYPSSKPSDSPDPASLSDDNDPDLSPGM